MFVEVDALKGNKILPCCHADLKTSKCEPWSPSAISQAKARAAMAELQVLSEAKGQAEAKPRREVIHGDPQQ